MDEAFSPYIARNRVIGPHTFDMHITDPNAKDWYDTSPNQWMLERQWCIDTIKPGFTALDCGAHHGLMSVLFSRLVGPSGVVHAWEALPSNAAVVERNAELNGCTNIVVHPRGLAAEPGRLPIDVNSGNIVILGQGHEAPPTGAVELVRLDDDVDPALRPDFLKIDVEGYEVDVLRGAARILAMRPIIMLELHNFLFRDRLQSVTEVLAVLRRHDYSIVVDNFTGTAAPPQTVIDPGPLSALMHAQLYCTPL